MQAALEILLGGPGYHMRTVIGEDKVDFWRAMNKNEVSQDQIKEHFKEYASVQDAPAVVYWDKILEAYPNAKVVMSTRPFDCWYRSVNNSIIFGWPGCPERYWGIFFLSKLSPFWYRWTDMIRVGWIKKFFKDDTSKAGFERAFTEWHKQVKEKCPKDNLLIFDVKEGWEPLCKFLGKPIPDVPFPNLNDTAQMQQLHRAISIQGWFLLTLVTGAVLGAGYLIKTNVFVNTN